jgi:hypothetical protein
VTTPRVSSVVRGQAAIAAVARHFRATLRQGADPRTARLVIAGKRIAVDVIAADRQIPSGARGARVKPPRLRFDRVVLALFARLRAGLSEDVPRGRMAVVTVTAPIRLAAKTAADVEKHIRALLGERSDGERPDRELARTIHGNRVRIRMMRGSTAASTKLVGFVHNRDSDPSILFDLLGALLRRIAAARGRTSGRAGSSRDRWLVIAIDDEPRWTETYRRVCDQLLYGTDYLRVVLVDAEQRVSLVSGR